MAANSGIFTFGDTIGNAGGFKNYSFGQDQGGFYISGMSVGQDKKGNIFDSGAGKKYLGNSASDLSGDVLNQYNKAMGIQPQQNTQNPSLLDTQDHPTGVQLPTDSLSNDAMYQNPSPPPDYSVFNDVPGSGGQVDQTGNVGNGNGANPSESGVPGVQIKSSTGGGSTTTVNPTRYSNQLNYLGYKMLSPQDLKKGLTSGQGLGTSKGAGNLTNPALVQRQSLLGR